MLRKFYAYAVIGVFICVGHEVADDDMHHFRIRIYGKCIPALFSGHGYFQLSLPGQIIHSVYYGFGKRHKVNLFTVH